MGHPYVLEVKSAVTGKPVKTLVQEALDQHHGVVADAALSLDISRQALYLRLDEYPELKTLIRRKRKQVSR